MSDIKMSLGDDVLYGGAVSEVNKLFQIACLEFSLTLLLYGFLNIQRFVYSLAS